MVQLSPLKATSSATPAHESDHVVIGGVALGFDELVNEDYLAPKQVASLHETFAGAEPFPHLVIEGLFSPRLLELVSGEFDSLGWTEWRRFDNDNEVKRASMPSTRFGRATRLYFDTIHSGPFLDFLEKVTGLNGLVPDAKLVTGGLHEIPPGGKFAVHTDFNHHRITRLDNRLVFITYLNKDWKSSYGGALELWDCETNTCKVEIDPVFGRSALFLQSSKSWHGHPKPVCAPGGRTRRSAAAYFYSNGRDDGDERSAPHTTLFPMPPVLTGRDKIRSALKYLTPPFLYDALRNLKLLGR